MKYESLAGTKQNNAKKEKKEKKVKKSWHPKKGEVVAAPVNEGRLQKERAAQRWARLQQEIEKKKLMKRSEEG